jgi:hypothetical protein
LEYAIINRRNAGFTFKEDYMDKVKERKILLSRFFRNDRRLYQVGKSAKIGWFDKFDRRFGKDKYAYFAREEEAEAIDMLAQPETLGDQKFIEALNEVGPPGYMKIDRFVGKYYYFDDKGDSIFKLEDKRDGVRDDVRGVLEDTKGRAYYFLKAIISLQEQGQWDRAYGGATWSDILGKMREIGGDYPAARDMPIFTSYRIYYKTGSRRYPTHTIPEEMIPLVKDELEKQKVVKDL